MKESEQRLLCRLGFLLFCIVPTFVVGFWIVRPVNKSDWESKLNQTFGVVSKIGEAKSTVPGAVELSQVQLSDPLSGQFAEIPSARIIYHGEKIRCHIETCSLRADKMSEFVNQAYSALQSDSQSQSLSLEINELTLVQSDKQSRTTRRQILHKVSITGTRMKNVFVVNVSFAMPGDTINKCKFSSTTTGNGSSRKVKLDFTTNGLQIPCWCLQDLIPQLALLGDACEFAGIMKYESENQTSAVSGDFYFVDLDHLINTTTSYVISGDPFVKITLDARLKNGRIESIRDGYFVGTAAGSRIDYRLLSFLSSELGLQMPVISETKSFGDFKGKFSYHGNSKMFSLHSDLPRGVILEDSFGNPILSESLRPTVPLDNFLRVIIPNGYQQTILKPNCQTLLKLLPSNEPSR